MIMPEIAESGTLPEVIREVRGQLGLTQSAFAELARVTLPSIYRYESGKSIPNASTLKMLCQLAQRVGNERAVYVLGRVLASRLNESSSASVQSQEQTSAQRLDLPTVVASCAGERGPVRHVLPRTPLEKILTESDSSEHSESLLPESDVARWVKRCLLEAETCLTLNLPAPSVLMGRRVIELIVWDASTKDEGTSPRDEIDKFSFRVALRKLKDFGLIDNRIFDWGNAIWYICNHAVNGGLYEASAHDARDTLNFAHWLRAYIYLLPAELEEFKNRRKVEPE